MSKENLENLENNDNSETTPNRTSELVGSRESGWAKLVKDITRPIRFVYQPIDLVPPSFYVNDVFFMRHDLTATLPNTKKIDISIYEPDAKNQWVILYLHGNSSSKLEANTLLNYLPYGFSLAAFDFMGCGMNMEEDTVSLGCRESEQVTVAVEQLQARGYSIILWGRSMGAATALKYGKAPLIVADSAFCSFKELCRQVAIKRSPDYVPSCLVSCLLPCFLIKLRKDIKKQADYDIDLLDIELDVANIDKNTTVIFMSGDDDTLIDKEHSQRLYNVFQGKNKHLQIFEGSHNSRRPDAVMRRIMKTIEQFVYQMEQITSTTRIQSSNGVELNQEEV